MKQLLILLCVLIGLLLGWDFIFSRKARVEESHYVKSNERYLVHFAVVVINKQFFEKEGYQTTESVRRLIGRTRLVPKILGKPKPDGVEFFIRKSWLMSAGEKIRITEEVTPEQREQLMPGVKKIFPSRWAGVIEFRGPLRRGGYEMAWSGFVSIDVLGGGGHGGSNSQTVFVENLGSGDMRSDS